MLKTLLLAAFAACLGSMTYVAISLPPLAANLCPACYDLVRIAPRLLVDRAMPDDRRDWLIREIDRSTETVSAFFGRPLEAPVVIGCSNDACDALLGGRGALGATYLIPPFPAVIRLAPRGLGEVILRHELAHVALRGRVGLRSRLRGDVPAWFDEGVAVMVSEDPRYLGPGDQPHERCRDQSAEPLPETTSDWGRRAGRERRIYAVAACRVLYWLHDNGGREGLVMALDEVAEGKRALP